MTRKPPESDEYIGPERLYDPAPQAEDDLWFLPEAPLERDWDMPGPRVDRRALVDPQAWQRAEAGQGRGLAQAAAAVARLDERLRLFGAPGVGPRLAMEEAAGLSWAHGIGVSPDRLALYDVLRLRFVMDDHRDLPGAHWAYRRLSGSLSPRDGLAGFLGRHVRSEALDQVMEQLTDRVLGPEFDMVAQDWLAALAVDLHPISRGAFAGFVWRLSDLSDAGAGIEGAVAAAKIGAEGLHALPFLPVGLSTQRGGVTGGDPAEHLAAWYSAVERGALHALMLLEHWQQWQGRAGEAIAGLKGRTPALLAEALLSRPAVSVEMVSQITDVSQAAARRNLIWFDTHGLAQEITGQGRFRMWKIQV